MEARRYLLSVDLAAIPRRECDVLVVGTGVAGLSCAVAAAEHSHVVITTKDTVSENNTAYAQGGIAAALGPDDSPELHARDTLAAGAGLCDEDPVMRLVAEGPERLMELIRLGAHFDQENGDLALGREAAHSMRRIVHAHGDATGREIHETLSRAVLAHPRAKILERTLLVDILTQDGRCFGALFLDLHSEELFSLLAPVTVLATGGIGALYSRTTNPLVATGDGIAAAYRAGAALKDMEFIQFHPTALAEGAPQRAADSDPMFLISEAVRGEGAVLRDAEGVAFMNDYHPLADLAPRDVVARAIFQRMRSTGRRWVNLDLTPIPPEVLTARFPTILQTLRHRGLDPFAQPIPVSPAAHYMMGGIQVDTHSRTSVSGLYACGECACTGLHGANRLASNSLLEGLVFGTGVGKDAASPTRSPGRLEAPAEFGEVHRAEEGEGDLDYRAAREALREVMWEKVGILRWAAGLEEVLARIEGWMQDVRVVRPHREAIELNSMLTVAQTMARSAALRQESRGAHFREDFPELNDHEWRRHIIRRLTHTNGALARLEIVEVEQFEEVTVGNG